MSVYNRIDQRTGNYIYLEVPHKYKCVYEHLLAKMASLGMDLLNDCAASCKGDNKQLILCWNMFQSACASYVMGDTAKADFLINYINCQFKFSCADYYDILVEGENPFDVTVRAYPKHYEFTVYHIGDGMTVELGDIVDTKEQLDNVTLELTEDGTYVLCVDLKENTTAEELHYITIPLRGIKNDELVASATVNITQQPQPLYVIYGYADNIADIPNKIAAGDFKKEFITEDKKVPEAFFNTYKFEMDAEDIEEGYLFLLLPNIKNYKLFKDDGARHAADLTHYNGEEDIEIHNKVYNVYGEYTFANSNYKFLIVKNK